MGFENRDYYRDEDERPHLRFAMPKVSKLFLSIAVGCLVIFLIQSGSGSVTRSFMLTSSLPDNLVQPWRWITYQYLHGGAGHYFFNMLGLFFFLPWLESRWGWQKTLVFYSLGGIVAGLFYVLLALAFPLHAGPGLIGASGSVFAIIGGCALFYPDRRIIFLFFPITMRALAGLYGLFFLLSTFADRNFSNAAHLGGLVFGFLAPYFAGPKLRDLRESFVAKQRSRAIESERNEQAEIDRILAKVSAQGMHSLSRAEQKTLKLATERQQKRNAMRR